MWAQDPAPQDTFMLRTGVYTDKNYVARKSVKLKDGFKYKAADGQKFTAKIDAGLLFPPSGGEYATPEGIIIGDPAQAGIVGSISGTASVSPSGAAMYQIPIDVPIGVNGMQPNISVVYNSQGGFGELGMGWGLAGLSSITRVPKTKFYDGVNDVIHFDDNDALALDGQRLILISGENLKDGAVYATQTENYSRIIVRRNVNDFISFKVTTKDQ